MRKLPNILSLIGAGLLVIGYTFKYLRWPGANLELMAGSFLLIIFFLPRYGYNLFYKLSHERSKLAAAFGGISACATGLAILFKTQHWPFAGPLVLLEFGFTGFFSLPTLMVSRMRSAPAGKDRIRILAGHLSLSLILIGLIFRIMHFPGGHPILGSGALMLVLLYLPLFASSVRMVEEKQKLFNRIGTLVLCAYVGFTIFGSGLSNIMLGSFVTIDTSLKESEVGPAKRAESLYYLLTELKKNEPGDKNVELYHTRAMKIKDLSEALYLHIERLKSHLICAVDGGDEVVPAPSIESINVKDNSDSPTRILVGNPEDLNKGAWSAVELKAKINVYRTDLLNMYPNEMLRKNANETIGLSTPDYFNKFDNYTQTWEVNNFAYKPVVTIITFLTKLQLDVKSAEATTVENMYNLAINAGVAPADAEKSQNSAPQK